MGIAAPNIYIYLVSSHPPMGQVLGSFSTIQKAGRQAKAQGQFALMGSLARVIFPILSGLVEQYCEETSSFALVRHMLTE